MDGMTWLLVGAILWMVSLPFWVYRAFRSRMGATQGARVLPEEWAMVYGHRCRPACCPRLEGAIPAQPRDRACEASAAAFMERYWQKLARPREARKHAHTGIRLALAFLVLSLVAAVAGRLGVQLLASALIAGRLGAQAAVCAAVALGLLLLLSGLAARGARQPRYRMPSRSDL